MLIVTLLRGTMSKKEDKPSKLVAVFNWVKGDTLSPTLYDSVVTHFKMLRLLKEVEKQTSLDVTLRKKSMKLDRLQRSLKRSNVSFAEYQWARIRYHIMLFFYR